MLKNLQNEELSALSIDERENFLKYANLRKGIGLCLIHVLLIENLKIAGTL